MAAGVREVAETLARLAEAVAADATLPPQLAGLLMSLLGMVIGSLIPQFSRDRGQSVQGITASASARA